MSQKGIKFRIGITNIPVMKISYVLIFLLLAGCASSYKSINPQNFAYNNPVVNNCLKYDYQYDVLTLSKNNKLAKKEAKYNLRVISVELTNLTNHDIVFSKDVTVIMGQSAILPVVPEIVKARIHQVVPMYLFYCLGIITFTKYEENSSKTTVIPVGIPIALGNMIVANTANEKFLKELKLYNLSDKVIRSGETVYGILSFNATGNTPLFFQLKEEGCGEIINLLQSEPDRHDIKNRIYFEKSDSTYENYILRMKDMLKQDKGIISVEFIEKRNKKGTILYRGFKARHKYGVNQEYAYKIGTWEYYLEDGKLDNTIQYDMRERPVQ